MSTLDTGSTAASFSSSAIHSGLAASPRGGWRSVLSDSTVVRLFLTVWLIYTIHFATDIVRETYLAMSLGERLSIRVDEYVGLHPDIFELEGRGAFITNNPGASMAGAIPYAIARPFIDGLFRLRPSLAQPKPPTTYDDPRPNRRRFLNAARERGLDVRFGLAAASMHAGLMVPLAAAAVVLVFLYLRGRLRDERAALWLALLYAFGTPIFFRSAFINQNALTAHATLAAYILLTGGVGTDNDRGVLPSRRVAGAGALLGFGVLCDYSGVPLAIAFGVWLLLIGWKGGGVRSAVNNIVSFGMGALAPIAVLLAYQWAAFGNPILPAQSYMPPTRYSVLGWHGFIWPNAELMWRNLFDPRYGLFAFCPLLLLAVAAPFMSHRPGGPTKRELMLGFGATAALYLFLCSVAFAFLQWNTGVRYLVPAVPLLFFACVPVLLRLPRWARLLVVVPTLAISWAVSMTRADVPAALTRVITDGVTLPWLSVLQRTASGYPMALRGWASPLIVMLVVALLLWLIWRRHAPRATSLRSA